MSGTIFINYRLEDSIGSYHQVYDRLSHTFGRKNLFMDVDHIPASRFEAHLNSQVDECGLFLASWFETAGWK